MEMSIEEHKAQLKKLKSFHNGSYGASINFAIETVRKYQQITQIVKGFDDRKYFYPTLMDKLHEVLEDGNVD